MDIHKYIAVSSYSKVLKMEWGIEFPINKESTMMFRSPLIPLKFYLGIEPSNRLTVFTYKIGTGFSSAIVENIEQCNGAIKLVFGLQDDFKANDIAEQLYNLNPNEKESFDVLISHRNHIKMFCRDSELFAGSQNFPKSADFDDPNHKYHYDLEDILIKIENFDHDYAIKAAKYLMARENSKPFSILGMSKSQIAEKLIALSNDVPDVKRFEVGVIDVFNAVFEHLSLSLSDFEEHVLAEKRYFNLSRISMLEDTSGYFIEGLVKLLDDLGKYRIIDVRAVSFSSSVMELLNIIIDDTLNEVQFDLKSKFFTEFDEEVNSRVGKHYENQRGLGCLVAELEMEEDRPKLLKDYEKEVSQENEQAIKDYCEEYNSILKSKLEEYI